MRTASSCSQPFMALHLEHVLERTFKFFADIHCRLNMNSVSVRERLREPQLVHLYRNEGQTNRMFGK